MELHCHSNCSDGTLRPAELVARAVQDGVDLLVLTDHDTVSGSTELLAAGLEAGLEARLGIEVNCAGEGAADRVHILGYGFRPDAPGFAQRLAEFRERRTVRARRIVEKLRALGVAVEFEQVSAGARETLGRPHVADALRRLGVVRSRQEAFDRFLMRGKPAYVDSMGPSPTEAIALIRDAGGVACLAHPQTAGGQSELDALHRVGLQGIEALYSGHTPSQARAYGDWAKGHGLLVCGGTDFHGPRTGRQSRLGVEYDEQACQALLGALWR